MENKISLAVRKLKIKIMIQNTYYILNQKNIKIDDML